MKFPLKGLIVLSIMSCNQPFVHSENGIVKPSSSLGKKTHTQSHPAKLDQKNTTDIYHRYIPASVQVLLKKQLPGWKLPEPDKWEKFWFNHYRKDNTLVNFAFGDFNGDGRHDYAFILQKEKKDFALWILQSNHDTYQTIKLIQYVDISQPLDFGIELVPAGRLNYIDFDADEVKSLKLKNSAIQVLYFERGAETFYWNQNLYKSVTTAD